MTAVGRDNAGNLVSSDWTKCQGTFQVPPSAAGKSVRFGAVAGSCPKPGFTYG